MRYFLTMMAWTALVLLGPAKVSLAQQQIPDPGPGAAQTEDQLPRKQSSNEMLDQDAAAYARNQGVDVSEAKRRLVAMRDSVKETDRIREEFGDRVAGISILHQPTFEIQVLLTGDQPVPGRSLNAGGISVPVAFKTGARSNFGRLRAAMENHGRAVSGKFAGNHGMGIDQRTGELVVIANAKGSAAAQAAKARKSEIEALTGVPVRIEAIDAVSFDADIRGGSKYTGKNAAGSTYLCTSGFVVYNSTTTAGTTAAHCEDGTPTYYNPNGSQIPVTIVGSWGSSTQDIQIFTSSYVKRPEFYVDTAKTLVRTPVG